jgi:disulfide bond formation protein DsbB
VTDQSDSDLIAFIIEGRTIDHPDNITGVAMLPRGGNPSLSDQDIANIVAYIKGQQ